jgi:putative ABC transport system ATP-binding protein
MTAPTLAAFDVSKSYGLGRQRVEALKPISFRLEQGDFVMVSGPSGSGKSTFLAIISGLLQPTSGHMEVMGQPIAAMGRDAFDRFRLQHFGFIFQQDHLLPPLTAVEQVTLVLQRQGVRPRLAIQRAEAALARVGLSERLGNRPAEMSGGERQRVAIARALAKEPKVLFADEPTSALDTGNGRRVVELLRQAAIEDGAAIVCVTHDQRLIRHATRTLELEDGAELRSGYGEGLSATSSI